MLRCGKPWVRLRCMLHQPWLHLGQLYRFSDRPYCPCLWQWFGNHRRVQHAHVGRCWQEACTEMLRTKATVAKTFHTHGDSCNCMKRAG